MFNRVCRVAQPKHLILTDRKINNIKQYFSYFVWGCIVQGRSLMTSYAEHDSVIAIVLKRAYASQLCA